MTLDDLLQQIKEAKPEFIPFEPYVCGMPKAEVPVTHENPFVRAAIHVYFGDQDGAHNQLQPLEGDPIADYLHGIIHRREGDFWNANYWFRRANSVTQKIGTDPEGLTSAVGAPNGISSDIRQALFEEWASLVEIALNK